jgi:hypothetical protein
VTTDTEEQEKRILPKKKRQGSKLSFKEQGSVSCKRDLRREFEELHFWTREKKRQNLLAFLGTTNQIPST